MQFLADGMTGMDTGIDHLIIMVLLLQITAEMITACRHFCQKTFRMVAVPGPVGSGVITRELEMVMVEMGRGQDARD